MVPRTCSVWDDNKVRVLGPSWGWSLDIVCVPGTLVLSSRLLSMYQTFLPEKPYLQKTAGKLSGVSFLSAMSPSALLLSSLCCLHEICSDFIVYYHLDKKRSSVKFTSAFTVRVFCRLCSLWRWNQDRDILLGGALVTEKSKMQGWVQEADRPSCRCDQVFVSTEKSSGATKARWRSPAGWEGRVQMAQLWYHSSTVIAQRPPGEECDLSLKAKTDPGGANGWRHQLITRSQPGGQSS